MKKRNKLVVLLLLSALAVVPYSISFSSGGGGGGKKPPQPNSPCQSINETPAPVILQFPSSYSGRTWPVIPNNNSDPNLATPGTSLFSSSSTFYCVVTIVGVNCPSYSKTYVWTTKSRQMNIPIPSTPSIDFNLSVEFYESCGAWDNNSFGPGRPFYAYSKYYTSWQANFFIPLTYTRTELC